MSHCCRTVLTLAVNQGWGGRQSEQKRAELFQGVIELFKSKDKKSEDVEKLADWLYEQVSTKFNCDIEDESDIEVAHILVKLFQSLSKGDETFFHEVMNHSSTGATQSSMQVVAGQEDLESGDDSEENSASGSDGEEDEEMV